MHLHRSYCVLCSENIKDIKYNLKTSYSDKSTILLIKFVERLIENLSLLHCNICLQCYNLLNELDSLQVRKMEIEDMLKSNITKAKLSQDSIQHQHLFLNNLTGQTLDSVVTKTKHRFKDNNVNHLKTNSVMENLEVDKTSKKIIHGYISETKVLKKCNMNKLLNKSCMALDNNFSLVNSHISERIKVNLRSTSSIPSVTLCELCGQSFKTKSGFHQHIVKHDTDVGESIFKRKVPFDFTCNYCNKSFTQKVSLARHMNRHTGQMPYQCEECGKQYLHHSSFGIHKKAHLGQRLHQCSECNSSFLTSSHLKRHRRVHTGEKQHICKTCGKCFAENYNLVAHRKTHISRDSCI